MFAPADAARRVGCVIALVLFAVFPEGGWAQQILETYGKTLTRYDPATTTGGQGVQPRFDQRGVGLDGSMHAASVFGWSLAGNPFGEGVVGGGRLGEVNLCTGTYNPTEIDIALPAPGNSRWVVGRSWNLRQQTTGGTRIDSNGFQGKNWFQLSQPEILRHQGAVHDEGTDPDTVYLVYGADRYLEFIQTTAGSSTEFKGKNGTAGIVKYVAGTPDVYEYYDQRGNVISFFGFDTSGGAADGQFWKIVDPKGNVAYVGDATTASTAVTNGYTSKRIQVAYDGADNDGRRYTYTYTTIDSVVRLTQVKAEVKTSGTWASPSGVTEVAKVDYDYYTGGSSNGDNGNLKTATVTLPLSPSGVSLTKTTYYRYYTGAYNASTNPGYANSLKLVLDPEGVRLHSSYSSDSDATLKPDCAAYFTYPSGSDYRIATVFFNGQCGCSGGTNGTYTLSYGDSSSYSTYIGNTSYDTGWAKRAIVARPDSTYMTQYFDEVAQPLSNIVTDTDPSGSPTQTWATEVVRNSNGCVTEVHSPANITAYTHGGGSPGTYTRSSGAGLVTVYERKSTGNMTGFVASTRWKEGNTGTEYYTTVTNYGDATKTVGSQTLAAPFLTDVSPYKTVHDTTGLGTSGTDYDTTSFTKTMYSTGAELALKKWLTTNPTVTTANNGSNSATSSSRYIRKDGSTAFIEGTDGVFRYTRINGKGLVDKRIDDPQTNHGSDFASGDDPNTDFGVTENGNGLRVITTYTYDAQGRLDETTLPSGRVTKNYYSKLADGRMVTFSIPRYDGGGNDAYGPISYTVTNLAGRVEFQATLANGAVDLGSVALADWVDETTGNEFDAVHNTLEGGSRANWQNVSMSVYNEGGTRVTESRMYYDVPTSGFGSAGTNYDKTEYGYDTMGRRVRNKVADGTISRSVFDTLGRATASWIGTDDTGATATDPDGSGAPNNMVKTSTTTYDGGSAGGNSYVTSRAQDGDGDWTGSTDRRTTNYTNDVRGRVLVVENPQSPHMFNKYDNRGRGLASGQFSSIASINVSTDDPTTETTNRVGLSQAFYDERGQVWKTQRHKIDVSDGSDDDNLQTLSWYDATGQRIKSDGEQLTKTLYDRLHRATNQFVLASVHASGGGSETAYADADDVADDYVLEEQQTYYLDSGAGAGQPLMRVTINRHYDDTSTTGAMDTDTDLSLVDYAGSKIKGRAQITMMFYDSWDRMNETAAIGTNGGSNIDRDSPGSITRSDTMLVTTSSFDDAGRVYEVSDPRAIETRTLFDDSGRRIATIANYVNGTPSSSTGDDDVYTRYVYDDGHMTQMWVDIDGDGIQDAGVDQVTTYTFGVPKGGSAGDSNIASNSLLWKTTYPDSASGTDLVTFAYNALSQEMWKKDQAGNIIETNYDTAGRVTHKRASTTVGGFDTSVLRISTTYNSRGMVELITQYNNATVGSGSVVNEVKNTYDSWANLSQLEQDKDSAVSGGGNQYTVSWTFAKATGGRNTIRRTGISIPLSSGFVTSYTYDYGAGSSIADNTSRVYQIKTAGGTALVTYSYNGVSQLIRTFLEEPDVFYDLDGTSARTYTDLDRFDRTIGSAWTKKLGGGDKSYYSVSIGYDRNSNITDITDNVLKAGVAGNRNFDVKYAIDGLNRVSQADEGTFSGGAISNRTRQENWTLDQVGNWELNQVDLDGDLNFNEAGELNDDRTHNVVNELTARDTDDNGSDNYTLTYDAVGNLTNDGQSYKYTPDVWGRVITVKKQDDTVLALFGYNGLGHRISFREDTDNDGDSDVNDKTFYLVYDDGWRIVATLRESDTSVKEQFLNHNAGLGGYGGAFGGIGGYIDHVVMRDRDANTAWASAADGTPEERRYHCQNWRADVSAVVTSAGKLVETAKNSAYGIAYGLPVGDTDSDGDYDAGDDTNITGGTYEIRKDAELDGDADANDVTHATSIKGAHQTLGRGVLSSTAVANRKGYAGYENDINLTKLSHVRNRILDNLLGRWTRRDPLQYHDGPSLTNYAAGLAVTRLDSHGLASCNVGGVRTYDSCTPDWVPDPVMPPNLPFEESPDQQCCRKKCLADPIAAGLVVCCNGRIVPCVCAPYRTMHDAFKQSPRFWRRYYHCIGLHERHNASVRTCAGDDPVVIGDSCTSVCNEAEAWDIFVNCMNFDCGDPGFIDPFELCICMRNQDAQIAGGRCMAQLHWDACQRCRRGYPMTPAEIGARMLDCAQIANDVFDQYDCEGIAKR